MLGVVFVTLLVIASVIVTLISYSRHQSVIRRQQAFSLACHEAFVSIEEAGNSWNKDGMEFENADITAKHRLKNAIALAPNQEKWGAASCLGNYLAVIETERRSFLASDGGYFTLPSDIVGYLEETHEQSLRCLDETQR